MCAHPPESSPARKLVGVSTTRAATVESATWEARHSPLPTLLGDRCSWTDPCHLLPVRPLQATTRHSSARTTPAQPCTFGRPASKLSPSGKKRRGLAFGQHLPTSSSPTGGRSKGHRLDTCAALAFCWALQTSPERALQPAPFCDSRNPYQLEISATLLGGRNPVSATLHHNCMFGVHRPFLKAFTLSAYSGRLHFLCYLLLQKKKEQKGS